MSLPGPRFTYDDYKLLPEDKRYEVIEGDLMMTPSPNFHHQAIVAKLMLLLGSFVEQQRLGMVLPAPMDVILSLENVVQPDLLYLAEERLGIADPAGGIRGAPDLVVEILSPSTASRDQVVKRKLYAKYGVREYWIVDPQGRSIEVLTPSPNGLDTWRVFPADSMLVSPLLPELSIQVAKVFPA